MNSMKDSHRGISKKQPILLFLFLSFAFTWAFLFPSLWFHLQAAPIVSFLANLGPAAAALIVLSQRGYYDERKTLIKEAIAWRTPVRGYFLAVLIPMAILVLALVALIVVSGTGFHWYENAFGIWLDSMIFGRLLRAFGEEIGWRGFLLPSLQARMTGLRASVLVGLIWWTWHLPVLLGLRDFNLLIDFCFLIEVLSLSTILTWLRNLTPGSLVPVTILHAAFNSGLDTIQLPNKTGYILRWNIYVASATLLTAGFIFTIAGKELGQPQAGTGAVKEPDQLASEPSDSNKESASNT